MNEDGKTVYCVYNWGNAFESSETRKLKNMAFVLYRVNHDSLAHKSIMLLENGPQILGIWHCMLGIAARSGIRGTLSEKNTALNATQIALMIGTKPEFVNLSLNVLTDEMIKYLVVEPWPLPEDKIMTGDTTAIRMYQPEAPHKGPERKRSGKSPGTPADSPADQTRPDRPDIIDGRDDPTKPKTSVGTGEDRSGITARRSNGELNDKAKVLKELEEVDVSPYIERNLKPRGMITEAITGTKSGKVHSPEIPALMDALCAHPEYEGKADVLLMKIAKFTKDHANEQLADGKCQDRNGYAAGVVRNMLDALVNGSSQHDGDSDD